jgi:hypothetical protein
MAVSLLGARLPRFQNFAIQCRRIGRRSCRSMPIDIMETTDNFKLCKL